LAAIGRAGTRDVECEVPAVQTEPDAHFEGFLLDERISMVDQQDIALRLNAQGVVRVQRIVTNLEGVAGIPRADAFGAVDQPADPVVVSDASGP
jgi:hypothetical protein